MRTLGSLSLILWIIALSGYGYAGSPANAAASAGTRISSDVGFILAPTWQIAEAHGKPTKVFEDTPQRLGCPFKMAGARGIRGYVAVAGKPASACRADIFFTRPTQTTVAKQIVQAVRAVP